MNKKDIKITTSYYLTKTLIPQITFWEFCTPHPSSMGDVYIRGQI